MKKLLYILFVLPLVIVGQSTDQNYIKNTIYTQAYSVSETTASTSISENDKIETVTYYDGLGRPIQSVSQRAGGNKEDIISYFEYDNLGRQIKEYLPYAEMTNGGNYRTNAFNDIGTFYNTPKYENTLNPFAEKLIESSPLNRVFEQASPGEDWKMSNNHTIKLDYQTNSTNEVFFFDIQLKNGDTEDPILGNVGYYLPNELTKNVIKDENWVASDGTNRTTEEFKDKLGRVILKRTYADVSGVSTSHDTYYIYDSFGNLSFVIPPLAVDRILDSNNDVITTVLDDLCYQYRYDKRNRIVEKKLPGSDWDYIIYNINNQPILTQNPILRETDEWTFTKYDALGRVIFTGIYSDANSRILMQSDADSFNTVYEARTSSGNDVNGTNIYYTFSNSFPDDDGSMNILTVNYYDDYDWNPTGGIEASYSVTPSSNISFANSTLKKETNTNSWDEGFITDQNKTIYGDGYIQYTVNQTDKRIVVGLSKTDETYNENYTSINYGIYTGSGTAKKVYIYEEGVSISPPPTYFEIGDEFRVERTGSQILYKKNGVTFYASTTPVTGELIGDGSFYHQNASISNVHIGFTALEQPLTNNVKGLATGSLVRVLGTNDWITTTSYYDVKGNPIHIMSENEYLSTSDVVNTLVDFVGKPVKTKSTHIKNLNNANDTYYAVVVEDNFKYDHAGRLLEQFQQINNNDTERIVQNKYDELGQLVLKNVGGAITSISTYINFNPNINVNGITISKLTGSSSWSDGLSTIESFSNDGYLSVVMPQSNKTLKFGLTYITQAATDDMNFSIAPQYNGKVRVYENGSNKGDKTTYIPGDNLVVRRTGTTIDYLKNGEVFYTSTVASTTAAMRGDAFLYHVNGSIQNFTIVNENIRLQQVDYTYNIRGWLKNINEDAKDDNDLFNFTLMYNNPTSGTALFNGNISQTSWNTLNTDSSIKTYTYNYDALNRIVSGIDNTGYYNLSGITYDKNGNILNLNRQGHIVNNPDILVATDFGLMDDLNYTYNGNQLLEVSDNSNSIYGFKDGTNTDNDYDYDKSGNLIKDENKDIYAIQYNHFNLPTRIEFGTFGGVGSISYVYDATGVKLSKFTSVLGGGSTLTHYAGNYVYQKIIPANPNPQFSPEFELQFFNHAEGYIEPLGKGFKYVYQYKDHLGNIRLSYSDNDKDGQIDIYKPGGIYWTPQDIDGDGDYANEILTENNYYPFGLKHKGYNNVITSTNAALKFKFNGKEFEESLGYNMYEMDMRSYDPAIARWTSIDPVTHHSMSTYNAFDNNPVYWADPSGSTVRASQVRGLWNGYMGTVPMFGDFSSPTEKDKKPSNPQDTNSQTGSSAVDTLTAEPSEFLDEVELDFNINSDYKYGIANIVSQIYANQYYSSQFITPWGIGVEWLTGNGPRVRNFENGDYFTELLKQHDFINDTKKIILANIKNGGELKGEGTYDLSGIQGVGKYLKDYSTLLTAGKTGNLAATYLGSYSLKWSADVKSNNSAIITFSVTNNSTMQSASRPPLLGYSPIWKNTIGKSINNYFSDGWGSKTTQNINWTETVSW